MAYFTLSFRLLNLQSQSFIIIIINDNSTSMKINLNVDDVAILQQDKYQPSVMGINVLKQSIRGVHIFVY